MVWQHLYSEAAHLAIAPCLGFWTSQLSSQLPALPRPPPCTSSRSSSSTEQQKQTPQKLQRSTKDKKSCVVFAGYINDGHMQYTVKFSSQWDFWIKRETLI